MTPWLHLLFIPGILIVGIQLGIQIGLRLAASRSDAGNGRAPAARRALSLSGADGKAR
jgi:hypothetical protein